ncbi:hypothetical protein QFC24_001544 [Naganishia onofrii]|uniref:Uncharacterized protein n=1 Tax=Naganishia onofrii TaxID=1851511 RepID=A0ACC2XRB8_9TREE|nr:hypothetical protein QFC24_001544 [Naganishia onofrii]
MSSIGTGYDLSVSTYSPDGRLFQVEYAAKAAENAGLAIGLKCTDGIVLAVEKIVQSKLLVKGANRRIMSLDNHVGMVSSGLLADGRHLAKRAREEAQSYRDQYGAPMTLKALIERVAMYEHAYTCYGSVRPFGISTIMAGVDKTGPQLYVVEPSGSYYGYRASAVGKGKQLAKTELEKLDLSSITVKQGVMEVARIAHLVHDDNKDGNFELEMTWIGPETKGFHEHVPSQLLQEAEDAAKRALEEAMEED